MALSQSVEIHLLLPWNGPIIKKNKKGDLKKGKKKIFYFFLYYVLINFILKKRADASMYKKTRLSFTFILYANNSSLIFTKLYYILFSIKVAKKERSNSLGIYAQQLIIYLFCYIILIFLIKLWNSNRPILYKIG